MTIEQLRARIARLTELLQALDENDRQIRRICYLPKPKETRH
jgi:hypothetical protein